MDKMHYDDRGYRIQISKEEYRKLIEIFEIRKLTGCILCSHKHTDEEHFFAHIDIKYLVKTLKDHAKMKKILDILGITEYE